MTLQREANLKLDHAVPQPLPFYDDPEVTPPHPFGSLVSSGAGMGAGVTTTTGDALNQSAIALSCDGGLNTPNIRVNKIRPTNSILSSHKVC